MPDEIVRFSEGKVYWMDLLGFKDGVTTGVVERAILRPGDWALDLVDGNDRIHVTLHSSGVRMLGGFELNRVKQRERVDATLTMNDDGSATLVGAWGGTNWVCRLGRESRSDR